MGNEYFMLIGIISAVIYIADAFVYAKVISVFGPQGRWCFVPLSGYFLWIKYNLYFWRLGR